MLLPPDVLWQQRLRNWSRYFMVAVLAIATGVLIGWQFDIVVLKKVSARLVAMNPASASCFILCSVSFLLLTSRNSNSRLLRLGSLLAILASALGALKICGILFNFDLHFDMLLFANRLGPEVTHGVANQMGTNTAACFLLTGIALLLIRYETFRNKLPMQYIALSIGLLSLLSLLGYLYQVESFYGFFSHVAMALHTATCFFLIGLALLFTHPDRGFMRELTSTLAGSITARVLVPAAILVPASLGLLRLWGYWNGVYENEFGVVLYALFTIIIFMGIIWFNTYSVNKRDLLKKATEDALHSSEEELRAIFDNAPDAVVLMDVDGRVAKWNNQAQELFGWEQKEMAGQLLNEKIIPDASKKALESTMKKFLTGGMKRSGERTIDLAAWRKDGTLVEVSFRISPLVRNQQQFFVGFIRDITDQKELENKLKLFNEELTRQVNDKTAELRDIMERVTDGFIALDEEFRYTYANKKAGQMIQRDPDSLIGKNVWEIFPHAVGTETYKAFNRAMEQQVQISNTDYYQPLDLWQENEIYPSPRGLSVFIRDISERKRAEEAIVSAKNMADKLIDSMPGVFYFYDENGRFIRWNREFETVTGYSGEEIADMHPSDFFEGEEKEYIIRRIQGVFEKGINDAEAHFVTKSGVKIPYYFKAVLINYEGKPCLLGSGIDIAKRKEAEERLKASEQKYKLLFQSNPLPMWMLSLPGYGIIEVNEAASKQYGYSREEFLQLDIFQLRPEEDIEKLKASTNYEYRGIHHSGIWRHRKKNGDIIFVDIVTYDLNYEGNSTRLVLANEVTERYLAEEKLKNSYESIRKLGEHLNNVREEERLHIAREIHDELGQLLTVLKMDVSWLNKRIDPGATQPVKEKLAELLTVIDTTVKTVRRIASELRPSLLDDLGLLAAMEWHLEEFEKRSGIGKELLLPEAELKLPDALKIGLFRIFQESLTNVARHSGAQKVNVKLQQNEKKLELTIADDGIGYNEKKATKKTLGLLGMRERTLMMGGEYSISALPGKGTVVKVVVPLGDKDQEN